MRPEIVTGQSASDGIARLLAVQPRTVPAGPPVSDQEIRHAAQFRPGSVEVVAKVDCYPMRISFTVPSIPVAQPRQRHRVLTVGGKTFAQNYTPKHSPVQDFKAIVRMTCHGHFPRAGWDFAAPMRLSIVAVFPRPKSKTRKRGDNPRLPKTSKPDFDNVAKSVADALTGLAWNDDAQVYDARLVKWIAAADEQPHVVITIEQEATP